MAISLAVLAVGSSATASLASPVLSSEPADAGASQSEDMYTQRIYATEVPSGSAEPEVTEPETGPMAVVTEGDGYTASLPRDASVTPLRFRVGDAWVAVRMSGLDSGPTVDGTLATYDDIAGADRVEFTATPTGIKEDIVLDDRPAANLEVLRYRYQLTTSPGVNPEIAADGGVNFVDEEGFRQFIIPRGVMLDSSSDGAASEDVKFSLTPGDAAQRWNLLVEPDLSWLRSNERTYPVYIDPTFESNLHGTRDCTLASNPGSTPSCGDDTIYTRAGLGLDDVRRRGLMKFDVSALPSTVTIHRATVKLHLDSSRSTTNKTATYNLHRVARAYNESATWRTPGDGSTWTGGSPLAPVVSSADLAGAGSGYKAFVGLASTFQGFVRGTVVNNGFVLKQASETVDNLLFFHSSSANNPAGVQPYVDLQFTIPDSAPGFRDDADSAPVNEPHEPEDTSIPERNTIDDTKVNEGAGIIQIENDPSLKPIAEKGLNNNRILNASYVSKMTPPGGRQNRIWVWAWSSVKIPWHETSANFSYSRAKAEWYGKSPRLADSITLTEDWTITGLAVSISGAGYDGSGSAAVSTTVYDTWRNHNNTESIKYSNGYILKVRRTARATFTFGYRSKTISATDSAWA